jgi:hypothetical protein
MRDDHEQGVGTGASAIATRRRAAANAARPSFGGTMRDHHRDRIGEDGHESRDAIDERGTVVRR